MFSDHDIARNACQLYGGQANLGYDWWWHSFTGTNAQTGEKKAFFIEYFVCNPAGGKEEPVFEPKPSYMMVKVGAWGEDHAQLHRFFGWKKIKVNRSVPYKLRADDCFATEGHICGSVDISESDAKDHPEWMSDAGSMSWDLRIKKVIPFNVGYGAGKIFRTLQIFEMFWHAEGMKSLYKGEVIWNGVKYNVRPSDCYGYQDKNWGKDFTTPWLWLSSCNLTSEITGKKLKNSVFDIGGGKPKAGPITLKGKLLSAFYYEGQNYEFNFSKLWTFVRTKFNCHETDDEVIWHVEQKTWRNKMVTDVRCFKKDMLLFRYQAPNGLKRHTRLWNGGNGTGTVSLYRDGKLIDRIHAENIGCEYGEYDRSAPY